MERKERWKRRLYELRRQTLRRRARLHAEHGRCMMCSCHRGKFVCDPVVCPVLSCKGPPIRPSSIRPAIAAPCARASPSFPSYLVFQHPFVCITKTSVRLDVTKAVTESPRRGCHFSKYVVCFCDVSFV